MRFSVRYFSVAATILLVTGGTWFFSQNHKPTIPLKIGDTEIKVEIARTEEARTQGLSGRESLGKNKGMLYVFDTQDFYVWGMNGMRFPLDIIWIGKDKTIVDVITDVQPESYPDYLYVNDFLAQYVLEANAGFFDKKKFKLGDSVEFSLEDRAQN